MIPTRRTLISPPTQSRALPGSVLYFDLSKGINSSDKYGNTGTSVSTTLESNCQVFDGLSSYLPVTYTPGVNITAKPLSIFAYIRVGSEAGSAILVEKETSSGSDAQYSLVYTSYRLSCRLDGAERTVSAAGSISEQTWYLVGFIWKADGTVTAYINGVSSGTPGSYAGPVTSRTYLDIGRRESPPSAYFKGKVGEVWISNQDVTSNILDFFNKTKGRYGL